jgi:hypothetical protein
MMELIKALTSNDVGSTGGHQSGVVIPKNVARGEFFPLLNAEEINPRIILDAFAPDIGRSLRLNYIYYNGKLHNTSTRNEFRLTGISPFLKEAGAQEGDNLILIKARSFRYLIKIETCTSQILNEKIQIRLNDQWSLRGKE